MKRATAVNSHFYGEPTTWAVHRCHWGVPEFGDRRYRCLADEKVLTGDWTKMRNADNGRLAWTADFSALTDDGTYIVEAKRSHFGHSMWSSPFNISSTVFAEPLRASLDAFYLARCGVAVGPVFAPDVDMNSVASFSHGECHLGDATATIDAKHTHAAEPGHVDGWGGWHDAGDFGKYTENTAFTVATLLKAWEHFGHALTDKVAGTVDEPRAPTSRADQAAAQGAEPAGGPSRPAGARPRLPRVLAEAVWGLEWLLRMQRADGAAWHKLSWPGFEDLQIMPEHDVAQGGATSRFLAPVSSDAAGALAATAALAARLLERHDPELARACLAAAERGYGWLRANPSVPPPSRSAFSTGAYASTNPLYYEGLRLWASAELWETTGDVAYLRDARALVDSVFTAGMAAGAAGECARLEGAPEPRCAFHPLLFDWSTVAPLGAACLALSARAAPTPADAQRSARLRGLLVAVADAVVEGAHAHPYGRPVGSMYHWGVNGLIARQALLLHWAQLALAADPHGPAAARASAGGDWRARSARFADAAGLGLAHLLGANDYGRSYVTAVGWGPPVNPHHRPSMAEHRPWPGMLVGGPHPAATDWLDDKLSFKTNEVAINWQAALVYCLAMFAPGALPNGQAGTAGQRYGQHQLRQIHTTQHGQVSAEHSRNRNEARSAAWEERCRALGAALAAVVVLVGVGALAAATREQRGGKERAARAAGADGGGRGEGGSGRAARWPDALLSRARQGGADGGLPLLPLRSTAAGRSEAHEHVCSPARPAVASAEEGSTADAQSNDGVPSCVASPSGEPRFHSCPSSPLGIGAFATVRKGDEGMAGEAAV